MIIVNLACTYQLRSQDRPTATPPSAPEVRSGKLDQAQPTDQAGVSGRVDRRRTLQSSTQSSPNPVSRGGRQLNPAGLGTITRRGLLVTDTGQDRAAIAG
jgi:hypothetical protein